MSRSSVDIGCPAYSPSEREPKYGSHTFTEVIEGYTTKISYDYYEEENQIRIVTLKVNTNLDVYDLDVICTNLIGFLEGKTAILETKIEIV